MQRDVFVVVALFQRLPNGSIFQRTEWPAHVTLASNFATDATREDVVDAVIRAGTAAEPLEFEFGADERFGRSRDVPVRLVRSGPAADVHAALLQQLEALPGFAPVTPEHWRDGYRPHVTLRPGIDVSEGDRRRARNVAVATLTTDTAELLWVG